MQKETETGIETGKETGIMTGIVTGTGTMTGAETETETGPTRTLQCQRGRQGHRRDRYRKLDRDIDATQIGN
jgi:hypothetical protein